MASHKYISKFFKNGRWQYNYGQQGPYGGSTPASSNRSPSGGPTSSGFKTAKNLKVSNTLDSIKYKLNNTQKKIKRKAWQLKNRYNMQKDQLKRAVKGSAAYKKAKSTMKSIKREYNALKVKHKKAKTLGDIGRENIKKYITKPLKKKIAKDKREQKLMKALEKTGLMTYESVLDWPWGKQVLGKYRVKRDGTREKIK